MSKKNNEITSDDLSIIQRFVNEYDWKTEIPYCINKLMVFLKI